jgi:hypothetical protein
MPVDDEIIKLILDLGQSGANVEEVAKKLDVLQLSSKDVVQTIDRLQRELDELNKQWVKGAISTGDFVKETNRIKESLESLQSIAGTAEQSTSGLGRGALQASFAFQDFTSVLAGGQGFGRALGAIQNNIPVVLSSLGVGAGLTGVVSVATVALGLLIDKFAAGSKEGKNFKEQLDEVTKSTTDYLEKLKPTLEEVTKYTEELQKQAELQKKAKEEKQREAAGEAIPFEAEDDKTRQAALVKLTEGRRPEVRDVMIKILTGQVEAEIKATEDEIKRIAAIPQPVGPGAIPVVDPRIAQLEGHIAALRGDAIKAAQLVTAQAFEGQAAAIEKIRKALPQGALREAFEKAGDVIIAEWTKEMRELGELREQKLGKQEMEKLTALSQVQENIKQQTLIKDREGEERAKETARQIEDRDRDRAKAIHDREMARRKALTAARKEPHEMALADVRRLTQWEGFGTPNVQEAEAMADDMITGLRNGLTRQQAAYQALFQQLHRMWQAQQGFRQMFQQMAPAFQYGTQPQMWSNQTVGLPF